MMTPRIGPSSVPMPPMITMIIIATTQFGSNAQARRDVKRRREADGAGQIRIPPRRSRRR